MVENVFRLILKWLTGERGGEEGAEPRTKAWPNSVECPRGGRDRDREGKVAD